MEDGDPFSPSRPGSRPGRLRHRSAFERDPAPKDTGNRRFTGISGDLLLAPDSAVRCPRTGEGHQHLSALLDPIISFKAEFSRVEAIDLIGTVRYEHHNPVIVADTREIKWLVGAFDLVSRGFQDRLHKILRPLPQNAFHLFLYRREV
jgi:hypothetical protein